MNTSNYIIPTKKNPVYTAECDYFGYIETRFYKDLIVNNSICSTFELNYKNAVNKLHEWIIDNKNVLNEYPKCKFNIELIDGTINKYNGTKRKKVYTISANKAKKLLF